MVLPATERASIRRFSLVVGVVVAVVVAGTWAWRAHDDPSLLSRSPSDAPYPWEVDNPGTATWSGGVVSGPAGGSVLRVAAADRPTEPLSLTATTRSDDGPDSTKTYIGIKTYIGSAGKNWPTYLGNVDIGTVIPPGDGDLVLWFSAKTSWTADVAPLPATLLTDQVSGQGGVTYLRYDAPDTGRLLHLTCSAAQDGRSASVYLTGYSAEGYELLPDASCPGDIRVWLDSSPRVLEIDDYADVGWTATLEQTAPVVAPDPSPGG